MHHLLRNCRKGRQPLLGHALDVGHICFVGEQQRLHAAFDQDFGIPLRPLDDFLHSTFPVVGRAAGRGRKWTAAMMYF
jgi:hypothetical protein